VAPLRLGGLRGKQSTPSIWLGGTGVVSAVGERERHDGQERDVARASFEADYKETVCFSICRIECSRL
jgi:hypothetical protein